jgi:protocatechuate 3,4-dioxygenase alpha subunit
MVQKLNALKESPSQTAGPYVHIGCTPNFVGNTGIYDEDLGIRMITGDAAGRRITIRGAVIDGGGAVLRDAMVEIWQADANGLFNSPEETRGAADLHFTGWGRSPGDFDTGDFTFKTIKPGAVALFASTSACKPGCISPRTGMPTPPTPRSAGSSTATASPP